jgi:hypothetical protein
MAMELNITRRNKLIQVNYQPSQVTSTTIPTQLFLFDNYQDTMTTSATTTTVMPEIQPTLHLSSEAVKDGAKQSYGDFRDDLLRDGYAVIKGAIPRERADKYADAMYSWLEGL